MSYLPKLLGVLYKTKLKEVHLITMALGLAFCVIALGFLNDHLNTVHRNHLYLLQKVNQELGYSHVWLDEFMNSSNYASSLNNPTNLNVQKAKKDLKKILQFNKTNEIIHLFNYKQQKSLISIQALLNKLEINANVCINSHIKKELPPDIYATHDEDFNKLKLAIERVYNSINLRLNTIINYIRYAQYLLFTLLLIHIILTILVIKNIRFKLIEREQRLTKAQNIAKLGFYNYIFSTKKWNVSKNILELVGYPKDNNMYKSWLDIIHKDDKDSVCSALKNTQNSLDLIYRVCKKNDDSILWVHHVSSPIKKRKNGDYIAIFGTIQDITEKHKLEHDFRNAFIDAQEQEKQSFGEELHDGMSQILAAENMYIETLLKINKDKSDATYRHLSTLKDLNLSAIEEARNIAHGLMSKQLKEKGLLEAVAHICRNYNHSKNVKFKFEKHGIVEKEITGEIKTNLFRLTQEISTNIIRHSGATKTSIIIKKIPENQLELTIKDNGVGMDLAKIKQENKGAGLKNIERRVKLLNGILKLETTPNSRVCYTITVPLDLN